MKNINVLLREEIYKLEKIVKHTSDRIKSAPQGTLRISKKNRGTEYYLKEEGSSKGNGKYIKKKDIKIAHQLAQKDYDIQVLKMAQKRISAIEKFIKLYDKTDLRTIYQKCGSYRRELICDAILSDVEFVKRWQEVEYVGKVFGDETKKIITERGESVRSKSEKIIADKLYALGIPYRYEYPIVLGGNITIYPDFTILKMPEREEVYLEHLGLMDDINYVESAILKLNTYEKNGIYPGVNLFITHETKKSPLNMRALDGLIKKVLCGERGEVFPIL